MPGCLVFASAVRLLGKLGAILRGVRCRARGTVVMRDYQPRSVRLFIKPYCGWCSQAMDWLDGKRIRYEVLDVIRDREAYAAMVRLSGQTLAPVIEVDGRVLADFGSRELAAFWTRLGSSELSS